MKNIISLLFALLSCTLMVSCDDEINDWGVDSSHDRLFRPLAFESKSVKATAVEISYNKVVNASVYIFEFSEDSLQFNHIVRTDTILADTLTVYSDDSNQTKVEYRTWFNNLKGVTKYSVRMKAISRALIESGYVSFFFETPKEQIFTSNVPEIDKVTLYWTPVNELTEFVVWERNSSTGELIMETERRINLQEEGVDLSAGMYVLEGLKGGTPYTLYAFNGENKRGEVSFRTSGIPNSVALTITPDTPINAELRRCAEEGATSLTLIFEGGQTYNYIGIKENESDPDGIIIPGGIENLAFAGTLSATGELPLLKLGAVSLNEIVQSVSFDKLALDGELNNYLFSFGANQFKTISFTGCNISNYNRSVVRCTTSGVKLDAVVFNNCIIDHVSNNGYALIVANPADLGTVTVSNCTFIEMGSLIDARGAVDDITFDKCTIYNNEFGASNFFRFQTQPTEIAVTNLIIAGPNKSTELGCGYSNYKYLDFATCYLTSEVKLNTSRPFANINTFSGTAEDLFTDPVNGDFHFKPGVKFPGEGVAGDPRWNKSN